MNGLRMLVGIATFLMNRGWGVSYSEAFVETIQLPTTLLFVNSFASRYIVCI
jgi:hypothetical protein